jgi:hypothetical protein
MVWRPMKECLDEIPFHFLTQATQKNLAHIERWLLKEWRHLCDVILQRKNEGTFENVMGICI